MEEDAREIRSLLSAISGSIFLLLFQVLCYLSPQSRVMFPLDKFTREEGSHFACDYPFNPFL